MAAWCSISGTRSSGGKVPVRIRMQDSKGEVLDQRARSIVIDGAETGSRGEQPAAANELFAVARGCTGR